MDPLKKKVTTVDEYIAGFPKDIQIVLGVLRDTIKRSAPAAVELISYGMPAYKYNGMLVYFAAFKNHCSFFPGNSRLFEELKDELKGFKTSTGTIQFTPENPLPPSLVKKIVKLRIKQNLEKVKTRKIKAGN